MTLATNVRTDSYDFKTAHEGTLTVEYTNMHVEVNADGYVTGVTYVEGDKTTYKLHFTNYSLIYIGLAYGFAGIYMYDVVGSGDDYKPKCTVECNGILLQNNDPWVNTRRQIIYGSDFNDTVWRQKWTKELDIADLNDWRTRFADSIGGNLGLTALKLPETPTVLNKAGRINITDATGEGLAIVPYGLYDFFTTNEPENIPFDTVDAAVQNQSFDYISGLPNLNNQPDWWLPHARMDADTDGLYSWYYPTTFNNYNCYANAAYKGNVNYWTDFSALDGMGLLMQCVYGLNMEQLHLGDKRYHKFKGVQWDVWLDGSGQSMAITIVPTYLGVPTQPKKCYFQIGYEDLGSGSGSNTGIGTVFVSPFISLDNGEVYNTTFVQLEQYIDTFIPMGGVSNLIVRWFYDPIPDNETEWHHYAFSNNIPWVGIEVDNDPLIKTGSGTGYFSNDLPVLLKDDSVSYWHVGQYNGDEYDDSDEDSDDIDEGEGYNGIGLLTKQYSLTPTRAQQLGWQLWEASFIDNIKLVNNSPMENVISLKALPFNVPGNQEEIVLGNVPMNVNGEKITSFDSKRLIGSIEVTGMYNSFLDFAPFTKISIFLPFIGFKDLDVSAIMYKTLTVYYITDILTGACRAELRVDNVPFICFDGDIGIDISLAASNRAQVEAAFITSAASSIASGVGAAASGHVAGGIANAAIGLAESAQNQYHTTNSGVPSPACAAYQTRDVYLIYDRPTYQDLKVFNHTHGRMCMLSRVLGTLNGYTQTSPEIDLSGVPCLQEEAQQIINILSSGFFVT